MNLSVDVKTIDQVNAIITNAIDNMLRNENLRHHFNCTQDDLENLEILIGLLNEKETLTIRKN